MHQQIQSVMATAAEASQCQKSVLPSADVMPDNISICHEIIAQGLIRAACQHAPFGSAR